jgi:hypothetical protein
MKSLIFMMMLSMFLVSAGVVYLSINRDPLGGVPHVDVALDPAPPEAKATLATPPPEDPAAVVPAEAIATPPVEASGDGLLTTPLPASEGADAIGEGTADTPATDGSDSEPLTTTSFPIPEPDTSALEAPAGEAAASDTAAPATDQ